MKKIILIAMLFVFNAYAINSIQRNIIQTSRDGKSNVTRFEGQEQNRVNAFENYEAEVYLNYVLHREKKSFDSIEGKKNVFVTALKKEDIEKLEEKNEKLKLINVKGYCIVPQTVDIGKQPMSATLHCNTNKGAIKFFGNYVPYNDLETLFITGLHIEKNNRKYKIHNAKILNGDRSSYNVATYVNNRKLEKIALESTSQASTSIAKGANDYLKRVEESKVVEEASKGDDKTQNSGSGTIVNQPVVTRNNLPPEAKDYVIKGAIDIVTGTVKAITDMYKSDLPYLYQVVGKSKIYIDLYVSDEEMEYDNTVDNRVNDKDYTTKGKQ